MRSSSTDRGVPLADRAGWTRLGAAVLLGLVAAAGPVVGHTSAQFTDTDEVAVVTVGTPDDFGTPVPALEQPGEPASARVPGGPPDPASTEPSGPSAWPGPDGSWSPHHPSLLPRVR
jgi:hypothetical protein